MGVDHDSFGRTTAEMQTAVHKAREEVGYSDYEPALEFARQSRTYARKARDIALNRNQERGR